MSKQDVRIEKDTFGPIEVPAARLWGAQTQRSRQNFAISSERMPSALIHALVLVKKAAALVNVENGSLPKDKGEALVKAADEVLAGQHEEEFPLIVWQTGSGTQTNMNVNEVLANRASELLGGERGEARRVHPNDDVNMGQYGHSNQPTHHTLYMYSYAGAPWRIQQRVRDVLNTQYQSGLGNGYGYLGDEDNGELSAWYLFSAMGFYPVSMGRPEYAIGAPFFQKMTVHLENGRDLVINAPNVSDTNRYIQGVTLNGTSYSRNYLLHTALTQGGTLDFTMGSAATTWGSGSGDLPTSLTTGSSAPQPLADVARGGSVSASAENSGSGEGAARAFDDDSLTKWLAFQSTPWLRYQLPSAKTVKLYTLTSANDFPARDPRAWTLQASNDGSTWVTLDTRTGQDFPWRFQTRAFAINNNTAYSQYRLQINETHGESTTQLAEFELLGR